MIPSFPYYTTLGVTYPAGLPDIEEMKRNTSAAFTEVIKRFNLPDDRVVPHTMTGTPKEQILKLANSIDADLIIIGSHRPSATTFLLGSNAARRGATRHLLGAEGLNNVVVLSLLRGAEFKDNYGVAIAAGPLQGLTAAPWWFWTNKTMCCTASW